jgi:two-component system LytT family response regulator
VKPFPIDRVQTTLSRIKAVITMERASKVEPTEDTLPLPVELSGEKLMVKGKDQIIFLDKEDILFVERQDNTTCITTKEEVLRCSSPLNVLEEKLTPPEFMRCHKSYLINLSHIKRIEPYGRWTYIVKMKGTEQTALMTAKCYEILKNMYQ